MKILQVVSLFSPVRGGGIIAVAYQLSRALAQRGHEVTIYTSDFAIDQEYIDSLRGVKVHTFHSYLSLGGMPLLMPGIIGMARNELKDFDVIHMHGYRGFHYIVLHHYARKYGIPYIVDAHGATARNSYGTVRHIIDIVFGNRILRDAVRVIAETELGAGEYRNAGVSEDRISILYPRFPVGDFSDPPPPGRFREKFNIKEKNIVLFMGRIAQVKGLGFLVESFCEVSRQRDDVILTIVGADDGYKATLQKIIDQLNLSDKVVFVGYLDGVEKQAALVDAAMMIQPSLYEQGLAWASVEAALCDTPIIVTKNTGAAEDALRMGAGYLVEYGIKDELRDTVQYILDNPDEAAENTRKAKEYIMANLSMESGIQEYDKLYASCLKERQIAG